MRPFVFAALAGLTLAACDPIEDGTQPVLDLPQECGAAGYQGLIGQPKTALDKMKFPLGTRVIGPEDAVTADYRPDRLNIEYSRAGLIEKISCY